MGKSAATSLCAVPATRFKHALFLMNLFNIP